MKIEVREFIDTDIEKIVDYFLNSDTNFLRGMGAEKSKLPNRHSWVKNLKLELTKPYSKKNNYYIIWLINNHSVGHSNINHIKFGETATMHLHLWKNEIQKSGLGLNFLKKTIPIYFEKLKLQKLICEPYAENIAPNKTLNKIGFNFIKTYKTIPGSINFIQKVNRYELTKEQMIKIKPS